MAKKASGTGAGTTARLAVPPDIKVITISAGSTVLVEVDVSEMRIPYTIALDGGVLIKSLVDRRAMVQPLPSGTHRLGWGFAHAVKDWKHRLVVLVDGVETELEKRSEAAKDNDHSVGVAFLVVA